MIQPLFPSVKRYITILLLFISYHNSFAQNTHILTGKIIDKSSKTPIKNAVVKIITEQDSILQSFVRTNADGTFQLKKIPAGKFILMISHPMYGEYVDNISIEKNNTILGNIGLTNKSTLLEAIIIKTGGAIKIKGDTTIYTADSFNVSANANVEELLKKLPGIQVDKNGEIKAMGEKVQKVLVDGEEFFGDDPGMAVKNLRADAVKEVQVFEKKSEQAEFTGIDDGKTQKTINLKLKEDKKKGYFGKVSVSGGRGNEITNRFNNNFLFGSFKGKRKLSAFLLNGNTAQDGLSWQESQKYGSSDDNNFEMWDEDGIFAANFSAPASDEEININTQNGFLRNVNGGIQYSNKWNDKHYFNFSPKYNQQDYTNVQNTNTITQLGNQSISQRDTSSLKLDRYNIKTSIIYDYKIDSNNSLKLTLKTNYYHSVSEQLTNTSSTNDSGKIVNKSFRIADIISDKYNQTGNLVLKHKFKKEKRTLSLNADWNNSISDAKNNQTTQLDSSIKQLAQTNKNSYNINTKLIYTEPLNKKWSLELGYQVVVNHGVNDQNTYTLNTANNQFDIVDSFLSRNYNQHVLTNTPSAKFNYAFKKIKFNIGSGVGFSKLDLTDQSYHKTYSRQYNSPTPNATFVYTYKGNHALRVKYNGYFTQPKIDQLQPLNNNNNIFNTFIGNSDLRPSFTNNINITHNGYNFFKNAWNYQSININVTSDAITNSRTIDYKTGISQTQAVNTNGNLNANIWCGFGSKLKKWDVNYELNVGTNYNRYADIINNNTSFSNTISTNVNIGCSKSKADKYDIGINNEFSSNINTNAQASSTNQFSSNTITAKATIYYKKVWSITTDYNYYARPGNNIQPDNINTHILNVQLQRTFRNNEFTVFISGKDLLNQNIGIDRSYNGNVITEELNQRLQRYFMLGLSWDFKNKGTSSKK